MTERRRCFWCKELKPLAEVRKRSVRFVDSRFPFGPFMDAVKRQRPRVRWGCIEPGCRERSKTRKKAARSTAT